MRLADDDPVVKLLGASWLRAVDWRWPAEDHRGRSEVPDESDERRRPHRCRHATEKAARPRASSLAVAGPGLPGLRRLHGSRLPEAQWGLWLRPHSRGLLDTRRRLWLLLCSHGLVDTHRRLWLRLYSRGLPSTLGGPRIAGLLGRRLAARGLRGLGVCLYGGLCGVHGLGLSARMGRGLPRALFAGDHLRSHGVGLARSRGCLHGVLGGRLTALLVRGLPLECRRPVSCRVRRVEARI
jgi:hypothetical protein